MYTVTAVAFSAPDAGENPALKCCSSRRVSNLKVNGVNKRGGSLVFKAGPVAFDQIRSRGFSEELIGTLVGASGGAKWLVLSQLDRVLLQRVLPKIPGPLHLLGSSIGAWRFACYAQDDPLAAIDRFEAAYVDQTYSEKPDAEEVTQKSRAILDIILGDNGAQQILDHPTLRTHIMTVRARHVTSSDSPPLLAAGLSLAMIANAAHRRALGGFFSRALFYDARNLPPFFDVCDFPIDRIPISAANLEDVITASGSIPLVLSGVRQIDGAPKGTYRDGGIIDYHLDLPAAADDRIALFPHFFDWLKPGWFDRQLAWRRVNPANFARTLLICPSAEFIAKLPGSKVPDRTDFVRMSPSERVKNWRNVIDQCRQLADELNDVLDQNAVPARLEAM